MKKNDPVAENHLQDVDAEEGTSEAIALAVRALEEAARLPERRDRRKARLSAFQDRLRPVWGPALDSLEELIATCAELGDRIAMYCGVDTKLFFALELLPNRACQVSWEIHALASLGHADGALGRWRTLHEIAVVSEFLQKFGEATAQRYLDHAYVKNRKLIREYQECQVRLGYPQIPQSDVVEAERQKSEMEAKYGEEFSEDYGWAATDCGKQKPSLFDVRVAAGYAHWKGHAGMANHAIHAGPHGILFRLGHPLNSPPRPLSGPSLLGLADPIHECALSLMHSTFASASVFLKGDPIPFDRQLEVVSRMKFVSDLSVRIGKESLIAATMMEKQFGTADVDAKEP